MINHCNWWKVDFNTQISSKNQIYLSGDRQTKSNRKQKRNSETNKNRKTFCRLTKNSLPAATPVQRDEETHNNCRLQLKNRFRNENFLRSVRELFPLMIMGLCVHKSCVPNTLCTTTFYHPPNFRMKIELQVQSSQGRSQQQAVKLHTVKRGKIFVTSLRLRRKLQVG